MISGDFFNAHKLGVDEDVQIWTDVHSLLNEYPDLTSACENIYKQSIGAMQYEDVGDLIDLAEESSSVLDAFDFISTAVSCNPLDIKGVIKYFKISLELSENSTVFSGVSEKDYVPAMVQLLSLAVRKNDKDLANEALSMREIDDELGAILIENNALPSQNDPIGLGL